MTTGRLDRIIEIQRKAVTRDSFGGEIETWVTLANVWAEKLSTKPAERFIKTSARTVNKSTAKFRILQRDDLDETMRVIDDRAVLWDIIGIIKNDRQFLTLQVGHLAS